LLSLKFILIFLATLENSALLLSEMVDQGMKGGNGQMKRKRERSGMREKKAGRRNRGRGREWMRKGREGDTEMEGRRRKE
jgi:hypothetical protein